MKGKCYSQESKKSMGSEAYRVKQVRVKCTDNRAGVPLMAHNTGRAPTLGVIRRDGETTWIWESSQA
jgi:hypothetical protein